MGGEIFVYKREQFHKFRHIIQVHLERIISPCTRKLYIYIEMDSSSVTETPKKAQVFLYEYSTPLGRTKTRIPRRIRIRRFFRVFMENSGIDINDIKLIRKLF